MTEIEKCKNESRYEIDKLIERTLILEFEQDLAFKESTGVNIFDYITESNTFSSFRNNEFRRLKLRQLRGYDE